MDYGRLPYYDSSVVVIPYYSKLAVCRRERKCIMRSKKSAVRFGLLTVLLICLSLASTSDAWTLYRPKLTTPDSLRVPDWRGGLRVYLWCGTPGATIRWTWASGYRAVAPNPTSSSQLYRGSILVTREGQMRARGFKTGYDAWQHPGHRFLV
jgi:hypothetical protein